MALNPSKWAVQTATVFAAAALVACTGSVDAGGQIQEPTGEVALADSTCNAPIQGYMTYLAQDEGTSGGYYVAAIVTAPGLGLENRVMWMGSREGRFIPRFCFRGVCTGGYWSYYGITGSFGGDTISVDTEGNTTLTVNGMPIQNLQVTMTSCVEPAGPGQPGLPPGTTTTLRGTDSSGNEVTIVLEEQYIT